MVVVLVVIDLVMMIMITAIVIMTTIMTNFSGVEYQHACTLQVL